jgi:hypothetical protein
MSKLVVIIPVSRPKLLPIIKEWLTLQSKVNKLDIVVEHGIGEAPSGQNIRQMYLDKYRGQDLYIHWLDDDNLISSDVIASIEYIINSGQKKILMFGQIWGTDGAKRLDAKPENCEPCKCDIAQLFVHASLLDGINWGSRYENDGDLIKDLYTKHPSKFTFINYINAYYNALNPSEENHLIA